MQTDLKEKVRKYEEFLNDKLRADLRGVLDFRESLYSEVTDYLQLKNTIDKMKQTHLPEKDLKTMVDIGSNFYMQAKIPDASHIIVAVGLNVFVEFTLDEALQFIDKRIDYLNDKTQNLSNKAADISARIKLVLEGLRELQFMEDFGATEQPRRVVW